MISIPPIRVMIVDDHPLVRAGLASVINQQLDMMAVAETEGGDGIIELYQHHRPDVILMDLRLRGDSGARLTRVIRETYPSACVLVISNYDTDDDITQALDAGAIGYVFKSVVEDELVDAIRAVKAGRRYLPIGVAARLLDLASELTLTRGESEILNLLNQGLRNRELGQANSTFPDERTRWRKVAAGVCSRQRAASLPRLHKHSTGAAGRANARHPSGAAAER